MIFHEGRWYKFTLWCRLAIIGWRGITLVVLWFKKNKEMSIFKSKWLLRLYCFLNKYVSSLLYATKLVYLIGQKFFGQNCRNFGLVSKLLSDEKFCPSKILSNISIQKSGKNLTKLSQFRLSVENFVRWIILSVENFVQRSFVR